MSGAGRIGFKGEVPAVGITYPEKRENPEKTKYEQMWERPEYRAVAPGESLAIKFLSVAHPPPDSEIIDFGCGTGKGSVMLAIMGGMRVTMVDFATNCLDDAMRQAVAMQERLTFLEHDLVEPLDVTAEYGFCTDVMEHIPEEQVQTVLRNMLSSAKKVFFQISLVDDCCGQLIGETLHTTVKPYEWWLDQFNQLGCYFYYVEDCNETAIFYVSGWADVSTIRENTEVNVDTSYIIENLKVNTATEYTQAVPHGLSGQEYMLLAGGPSLNEFEDEIIQKRQAGMPLITVNGTYQWALDRGLQPSAMVMVDARELNERFITEVVPNCQYLLASQVHPKVYEKIPPEQIVQWHVFYDDESRDYLRDKLEAWWPVPGGCTVTLRAIALMRLLGWKHGHIYGFDSCLKDGEHHAYDQPENDGEHLVNITVNDKTFSCTQWMALQAEDFKDLASFFGSELHLAVYGDGLIANILASAAKKNGD